MSPVRKTTPKQKTSTTPQRRAKKNTRVKRKGQKMAADENSAQGQNLGDALETSGNLGQVRDILFGSQMRDYDKRFARLEERLVTDIQSLKEDVRNQFESLETFVNKEVESLIDRLKDEQVERVGAVKEVTKEVSDLTRTVEKRTTKLDEQLTKVERDTRQQLLDQSKTLREETQQKFDELRRVLENEAGELRDSKTDRAMLADLMTEVAMRLRNEFELPEA